MTDHPTRADLDQKADDANEAGRRLAALLYPSPWCECPKCGEEFPEDDMIVTVLAPERREPADQAHEAVVELFSPCCKERMP